MSKPSTSISSPKIFKNPNFIGFRCISIVGLNLGGVNWLKGVIQEPLVAVLKGFCWCVLLWRIMFEGVVKYGFLAVSSAIVAFSGLYLQPRFTINLDEVYRMLAGIHELMGAPLTGTDLRAYVMAGGGIKLKNFKSRLKSKQRFLIFPTHGVNMKGLVSVVKNQKGQYDMKVNIPIGKGPDQRLFLIGDEEEYRIGSGLLSEPREDAQREVKDAERKHCEETKKIQRERS